MVQIPFLDCHMDKLSRFPAVICIVFCFRFSYNANHATLNRHLTFEELKQSEDALARLIQTAYYVVNISTP